MTALRAVAYYRKSNDDDGNSIDQQREWARAACEREGVELVAEFADQSKKGHETATRTAFLDMLRFCQEQARKRQPVKAVVCWHSNRFSRADSIETNHYLHLFREAGVSRFLTAQKWIDFARGEDRLVFGVTQEASDHKYVIDLAKATTRGRVASAREGRWAGGPIPMGYRAEREEVIVKGQRRLRPKRLVLGPDAEVAAVRLAFDLYTNTPLGLKGVAQELTRLRVATSKGRGGWTVSAVKKVLTNPVYVGRISWNRKSCGKFVGVIDGVPVDRPDGGRTRDNDRAQWVESEERHEPVIDLATFERCQQKLAGRGKGRKPTRGTFVLTGLLRCAHCGRAMVGRTDATGKRVYFCGGFNACGPGTCHYNAVLAQPLADALLDKLSVAWCGEDNIDAVREELLRQYTAEAQSGGHKVEGLRRRLKQVEADLADGFARLRTIDLSLLDGYQQGLKELQAEKGRLAADLRREEAAPKPAGEVLARVDKAVAKLRALRDAATKEPDLLRELLAEVVERIEVWFHHEPYGKTKTRCRFARALVWVREDVALLYTNVLDSWAQCTFVRSAPIVISAEDLARAA